MGGVREEMDEEREIKYRDKEGVERVCCLCVRRRRENRDGKRDRWYSAITPKAPFLRNRILFC